MALAWNPDMHPGNDLPTTEGPFRRCPSPLTIPTVGATYAGKRFS
jgi:hypothetical protein